MNGSARLHQPNIVTVFDVGDEDGSPYFAMELVEGQTLQSRLSPAQGLDFANVRQILIPLAAAIDYLHTAGLVHRDIKPSNVMLDAKNRMPDG